MPTIGFEDCPSRYQETSSYGNSHSQTRSGSMLHSTCAWAAASPAKPVAKVVTAIVDRDGGAPISSKHHERVLSMFCNRGEVEYNDAKLILRV